jgi:AcrR family transcriptional regulator
METMSEKVHQQMAARTRQLLKDVLAELIEEKGFESITIRDLTAKAELNRGTFYLHFRDKYDLMEQVQNELLEGFGEVIRRINPFGIVESITNRQPYPVLIQILQYLQGNGRFFKVLLGPNGDPAFPKKMREMIKANFYNKVIKPQTSNNVLDSIVQEYLPAIGTSAIFGLIEHWLETDMPHSPEEMATVYLKIIHFISSQIGQVNNTGFLN